MSNTMKDYDDNKQSDRYGKTLGDSIAHVNISTDKAFKDIADALKQIVNELPDSIEDLNSLNERVNRLENWLSDEARRQELMQRAIRQNEDQWRNGMHVVSDRIVDMHKDINTWMTKFNERLEDLEDLRDYQAAVAEGGETLPFEQVFDELLPFNPCSYCCDVSAQPAQWCVKWRPDAFEAAAQCSEQNCGHCIDETEMIVANAIADERQSIMSFLERLAQHFHDQALNELRKGTPQVATIELAKADAIDTVMLMINGIGWDDLGTAFKDTANE